MTNITNWKDPSFWMGISTISMAISIAMLNCQRVRYVGIPLILSVSSPKQQDKSSMWPLFRYEVHHPFWEIREWYDWQSFIMWVKHDYLWLILLMWVTQNKGLHQKHNLMLWVEFRPASVHGILGVQTLGASWYVKQSHITLPVLTGLAIVGSG